MELSEVRGAEENRVMKETMNEKDFIELMNKVKELDPERYRFTIYTLGLRESGAEEEDIHYLAIIPFLLMHICTSDITYEELTPTVNFFKISLAFVGHYL